MYRQALDHRSPKNGVWDIPLGVPYSSRCKLATGRSAIYHLLKKITKKRAQNVLLPAYIAEGVICPIIEAGFTVHLYKLNKDLSPNEADVKGLLGELDQPVLFVLIHFFGFICNSKSLNDVLKENKCIIFEDYAHALFPDPVVIADCLRSGNIALFSLNKFLPVMDGALLFSGREDVDVSIDEKHLLELPVGALSAYQSHLEAGKLLFIEHDNANAKEWLKQIGESYEKYYSFISNNFQLNRQSEASSAIERQVDFNSMRQKRTKNCEIVYKNLRNPMFVKVNNILSDGLAPWCIPVTVPIGHRKTIAESLFRQGILVSTLEEKWNHIPMDQIEKFQVENNFLKSHLLIPISEFISEDSVLEMVEKINKTQIVGAQK